MPSRVVFQHRRVGDPDCWEPLRENLSLFLGSPLCSVPCGGLQPQAGVEHWNTASLNGDALSVKCTPGLRLSKEKRL